MKFISGLSQKKQLTSLGFVNEQDLHVFNGLFESSSSLADHLFLGIIIEFIST